MILCQPRARMQRSRRRKVLQMLADDFTREQISARLNVSDKAVQRDIDVMRRLNHVKTVTALVVLAIKHSVIQVDLLPHLPVPVLFTEQATT